MVDINNIQNIYFIGIGGIGMSALARYFQSRGAQVGGYDKTATDLTRELEESGMEIHYYEAVELIPRNTQLVVYTPAVPAQHAELVFYQQNNYPVLKRSEVLGLITQHYQNICVAGTHGKTTISTMTGHLLRHSGYGSNAFLGGISVNYDTNFWSSEKNTCVIEADEYDRSFLRLNPDIAVITAMDADHLDIYGTEEAMEEAFIQFSQKIKPGGLLISKHGLKRTQDLQAAQHITYHLDNTDADVYASDIKVNNGSYIFNVHLKTEVLENVTLNIGGLHNIENMLAAVAVAHHLGIQADDIRQAVAAFKGVKRRFEYIVPPVDNRPVLIDDYAHHPEELKALITGARSLFGDKKLVVVFQPHLYTRTRDLATGFATSLDMADEVMLLPVYPARELPVKGVSSDMILTHMKLADKKVVEKDALLDEVAARLAGMDDLVLVMAGAGDIDLLLQPVKKILNSAHE
jgi:UDP-N-acetylmuramate--alanine ligase